MAFVLFILVNATLFIRPMEIVPDLQGVEIYLYLILACFALAIPEIMHYFTGEPTGGKSITLCVLGILFFVVLSFLASLQVAEAMRTGFYFLKVVIYFVLLVSLVNTPRRLTTFITCILLFTFAVASLTVLQYHEIIELPTLKASLKDHVVDPTTLETTYNLRLQGSGIFQDPNELCVMLAAMVPLCLFALTAPGAMLMRVLWGAELLLLGYGIRLTSSRGGLLALLAGLGALCWYRFGWRKTLALAGVGIPVLFVLLPDRQTDFSAATEGTGQSRIQVWSDWMMEFRASPILGNGMPLSKDEADSSADQPSEFKHLAHNSYIQGFADLGLFGGAFFLGAFVLALWSLIRLRPSETFIVDPDLRRLHPFLLGCVAAFATGLLTLSLCYVVTTFLILGLAAVFPRVTFSYPSIPALRLGAGLYGRLLVASVMFLTFSYVFVRLFINRFA